MPRVAGADMAKAGRLPGKICWIVFSSVVKEELSREKW